MNALSPLPCTKLFHSHCYLRNGVLVAELSSTTFLPLRYWYVEEAVTKVEILVCKLNAVSFITKATDCNSLIEAYLRMKYFCWLCTFSVHLWGKKSYVHNLLRMSWCQLYTQNKGNNEWLSAAYHEGQTCILRRIWMSLRNSPSSYSTKWLSFVI